MAASTNTNASDSTPTQDQDALPSPEPQPQPQPQPQQRPRRQNHGHSGASQNWFARFFHIKPATRVVALQTSKTKARKEVYKTLREWKQYGMEDVRLDKAENIVYGRVGEGNCKFLSFSSTGTQTNTVKSFASALSNSLWSSLPCWSTADTPTSA